MKVVYRITYPNGKIYVGQDVTNSLCYFGSPSSKHVMADFSEDQRRSFTVTKDILWESETASRQDVNEMERYFIEALQANNPDIGYNRWPKWRAPDTSESRSRE